jgi:hypothetical protein
MIGSEDADSDAATPDTYTGGLAGLNSIIPPGNSNCGAGTYTQAEFEAAEKAAALVEGGMAGFKAGDPKPVSGAIATDVATGYSETLKAYLAVRDEDAAVKAANKVLSDLLKVETTPDAQITTARENLAAAQTKQTAAHSKLYSVGAGPINMAGIAEWRAKFAVEDAVTAWNTGVSKLATAESDLNPLMYAKYVPLRNTDQIDGLIDMDDNVNLVNLRRYANAAGDNSAVQDAKTGVITEGPGSEDSGNFDAAGNLLVPKSAQDHDMDPETDKVLLPVQDEMSYMVVNTRLKSVSDTVAALTKFKGDNKNALLDTAIDVAIQRAEAEQAYYQEQFNAMVADTTNLDKTMDLPNTPEDEAAAAAYSIASRYSSFSTDRTARDNAGVTLETAFEAREAATSAVAAAFTDPQDFYQQLVDRREYTKAQKEAEVTRLAGLTGDDAATEAQTEAAVKAVTTATEALAAAEKAQAAFQDLVADDSPVKALVEELLKSDAAGDDGGALVDAIKGAYEVATDAVDALLGEDGEVTMNTADIATLDGRVTVNEGGIIANATNITANATNIMANTTAIGVERGRIDQNVMDIATNAGNIVVNEMNITSNTAAIGVNTGAIDANAMNITANERNISGNTAMIGELSESLEVVRAGVAASMALAGMPAINGRGISIGVGSFDGESAFAVGFQIQNEATSFKVGVTSSGGATGASAGVGFQF